MRANQESLPVATMCRMLDVSASGYYAWREREPSARAMSDAALLDKIRAIHKTSRGTYGAPRIHHELGEVQKLHVSRKRVARLMREAGIHAEGDRAAPSFASVLTQSAQPRLETPDVTAGRYERLPEPKAHKSPLGQQAVELSSTVMGEVASKLKTAGEAVEHLLRHAKKR